MPLIRGHRLRGRPRARVRRRVGVTAIGPVLLVLVLAATGCGAIGKAGAGAGEAALHEFAVAVQDGASNPRILLRHWRDFKDFRLGAFNAAERQRRARLISQGTRVLTRSVQARIDSTVFWRGALLRFRAQQIVTAALAGHPVSSVPLEFRETLAEVTQEMAVNIGCGAILDGLAPEDKPTEAGLSGLVRDPVQEATVKLAARGWGAPWTGLVDWVYYGRSVAEAGRRYGRLVGGYSTQPVTLSLVRPPVAKATAVYLRTCYRPPKPLRFAFHR